MKFLPFTPLIFPTYIIGMNSGKIAIFDSGVGGLKILEALKKRLSGEDFIYAFDRSHAPYGNRKESYIIRAAVSVCKRLESDGAKMIVVGCNTATAIAIDELRSRFTLPIIGVEPPVKLAEKEGGRTLVLCTVALLKSKRFKHLISEFNGSLVVSSQPSLASLIEQNFTDLSVLEDTVYKILEKNAGVDNIVLGCTHYYHLAPLIKKLRPTVKIFTACEGVCSRVEELLEEKNLRHTKGKGFVRYLYL